MEGKKLPAIGRVEICIIEEEQPRCSRSRTRSTTCSTWRAVRADRILDNGKLTPARQAGRDVFREHQPEITYTSST